MYLRLKDSADCTEADCIEAYLLFERVGVQIVFTVAHYILHRLALHVRMFAGCHGEWSLRSLYCGCWLD